MTRPTSPAFVAGATFALSANASSGLPMIYTSNTPAVRTVSGDIVTMVTSGTCDIAASNVGNASFAPLNTVLTFALVAAAAPAGVTNIPPTLSQWG